MGVWITCPRVWITRVDCGQPRTSLRIARWMGAFQPGCRNRRSWIGTDAIWLVMACRGYPPWLSPAGTATGSCVGTSRLAVFPTFHTTTVKTGFSISSYRLTRTRSQSRGTTRRSWSQVKRPVPAAPQRAGLRKSPDRELRSSAEVSSQAAPYRRDWASRERPAAQSPHHFPGFNAPWTRLS